MFDYMHLPSGVIVSVEIDDEGWFIASAYDLPGCVAQGRTAQEVIANMSGSIEDAFEVIEQGEADISYLASTSASFSSSDDSIRIQGTEAA